ncbi:MAG TPA: type II toxin-antitoxin system VapC family toxin [Candidatus Dormibacteraeota bacterium]|nr:type II toxin-antitoxin system VapC family toxin [Candidatus Dormibacteraeota bacterium]
MAGSAQVILLDTHVLIWLASEPGRLSKKATETIRKASNEGGVGISAITLWELAWLATHGRIVLSGTAEAFVERITSRTVILPITPRVAVLANQLPANYPGDPCDRLIGATAIAEGIALITKDRAIRNCREVKAIW